MTDPRATILQLIPELETGGAERGCVDMAIAIQQAGGRALVISAGGPMVDQVTAAGATHYEWPSIKSKNPLHIWQNAQRLKKFLRAEKVNLVHARSRVPAWAGYLACKAVGVPFMTTFHSTYNFSNPLKRWYNSVMARGQRVIAISDFIRRHIEAHYPECPPEHIRLIHRGIDVERFDVTQIGPERLIALTSQWGVAPDTKIILLPGRLTRWKGQMTLIEAMLHLNAPNTVAVLVGSDQGRTAYREKLVDAINTHGLAGKVLLPGECNDMPAAYALADVVVSASAEPEAFGRVIVEAQAIGKPVVVTDLGAVAETAGATGFGWIVPPSNSRAMATALRDALAIGQNERTARAAIARDYILGHYTRAKMCAATVAVYNELLAETKQNAALTPPRPDFRRAS